MLRPRLHHQLTARLARPIAARRPHSCTHQFASPRRIAAAQQPFGAPRLFTTSLSRRNSPLPPRPTSPQVTIATEPLPPVAEEPPEEPPQPTPRSRRRGLIYAAIFLFVGTSIGSLFRITISPPPLPLPGSDQDAYRTEKIGQRAAELPLVAELAADPAWTSWDAYSGLEGGEGALPPRVTSGAMSGARGLAYQRVFWHAGRGELVSVVYLGGGLSGWPGVVHGGALATVLDESLGRCAILHFPARTAVTARLELTYKAPTITEAFYVLRVKPVFSDGDGVVEGDGTRKSDRKLWVEGHVEDAKGKVCVQAKALFVVPKGLNLKPMVAGF